MVRGVLYAYLGLLDATSITCSLHSGSPGDFCQRSYASIISWRKGCNIGLWFRHDEEHNGKTVELLM